MRHTCKALILHCIDFRFGNALKNYLEYQNLLGDCDIVSVAGAAKNLITPEDASDREFVLRQIEISKRLHNIKQVILMNHTDCGAYGGKGAFASENEERAQHTQDLKNARDLIRTKHPELEIKIILAKLERSSTVEMEELN